MKKKVKEKLLKFVIFYFLKIRKELFFLVEKIENNSIGLGAWFVSFFSFVLLRNFFEIFSSGVNFLSQQKWSFFFLHSGVSYLFVFVVFVLISHFLTGERIEKVSKASLWLVPMILVSPIIDLIFFRQGYASIKYSELQIYDFGSFLSSAYNYIFFGQNGLLRFANKFWGWGDTQSFDAMLNNSFGVKIEIGILILFAMFYVFLKTKSVWKSLSFLIIARFIIFIFIFFPSLIAVFLDLPNNSSSFHNVSLLKPDFSWNLILFSLYSLLLVFFGIIWLWRYNKDKFLALVKNIRLERLALYLGIFYYGIYLAAPNFSFNFFDILIVIIASLAIIFSWMFAVGSNDLVDEAGDKISKSDRPLPSNKLSHEEVRKFNLIFRVLSYLFAFTAGYVFFLTILIRSAVAYLYSNFPFRLKRFPLISTFCIALAVTLGVLGGFLLFPQKTVFDFPLKMILFLLIFFTLGVNFIHIKDREGDKQEGVWTIPVIFGEVNGRLIVAFFLALAFFSGLLFYPNVPNFSRPFFLTMPFIGFWAVSRKKFKEGQVILLCAIFAVLVILFFERPLWLLIWK
jgi:4-hydroxybenzoate polyprenyltransferase